MSGFNLLGLGDYYVLMRNSLLKTYASLGLVGANASTTDVNKKFMTFYLKEFIKFYSL